MSYHANAALHINTKTTNNLAKQQEQITNPYLFPAFEGNPRAFSVKPQRQTHIGPGHPDSKHHCHTWLSPVLHNFEVYVKMQWRKAALEPGRMRVHSSISVWSIQWNKEVPLTQKGGPVEWCNTVITLTHRSLNRYSLACAPHLEGRNRQLEDKLLTT